VLGVLLDAIMTWLQVGLDDKPVSRPRVIVLCIFVVLTVALIEDLPDALRIGFADGSDFEIPKASPGAGAEVAHFVPVIEGRPDVAAMSIWENVLPTRGD
jgi:hypothetical protein